MSAGLLSRIRGVIADSLFVPQCPICREPSENSVCPVCKKRLDAVFSPMEFYRREMNYQAGVSAFDFDNDDVRKLVYSLKRRGTRSAVSSAGEALYGAMTKNVAYMSADCITWVPRDPKSVRRFGFDQARLIALYLSQRCSISARELVKRVGKARMQKTLDKEGRRLNVKNKFFCPEEVFGGEVILVDDMVTSGATVNEVSRALRAAGFDSVLVLSLASADKRPSLNTYNKNF